MPGSVLTSLRQPKVAVMLMLGFSSGLPFLLTGNTLGYWLRDEGTTLKAIGFLSWVGLAYSLKFLWAPVVDRVDAPVFGRLAGAAAGWSSASCWSPSGSSAFRPSDRRRARELGALALVVAFASSTQDIVVDAWRIEAASDSDELGLLSAAYQLGYRAALLVTDALILIAANHLGWPVSYLAMAVLMGSAWRAAFVALEPPRAQAVMAEDEGLAALDAARLHRCGRRPVRRVLPRLRLAGAADACGDQPVSSARVRHGTNGQPVLPRPRAHQGRGWRRARVDRVRVSLLGIAAGGFAPCGSAISDADRRRHPAEPRHLRVRASSRTTGPDLRTFGAVMAADNFGISFAGVALVTYMSSLTSLGYTATQYALLSSAVRLRRQVREGFLRCGSRTPGERPDAARRLRAVLHRRRPAWDSGAHPVHRARRASAVRPKSAVP